MSGKQMLSQDISGILSEMQNAGISEMISIVKKIDALKVALESVGAFHEKAIAYARLEAEALLRVMELGGENKLGLVHRRTAKWLYGLSENERDRYLAMCSEGLTIDQVYKREVFDAKKQEGKLRKAAYWRQTALESIKEDGIIELKPIAERIKKDFGFDYRADANDVIDGIRKRLRDSGAVGVGDDRGTYVMPNADNRRLVVDAIVMRYESICNDLNSINTIAKTSGVKLTKDDIPTSISAAVFKGERWIPHILFALVSAGALEEDEVFMSAVRKQFAKEMEFVKATAGIARKDYIKIQYEKEFGRQEV